MRATLFSLISLFLSCFILLTANGLINVLMPVRMALETFDTESIGLVQSLYFVGVLIGAIYSKKLIIRAGHIRMFAGCVSIGAVSILLCSLHEDIYLWGGMRMVLGFCNASAFAAMESWLSDRTTSSNRGRVLAVYNATMLAGLFAGQFFMNLADPEESKLFVIGGILLSLAVIPIALSKHKGPRIEETRSVSLLALYRVSPLGVVSCLVSGMIYAAIFNLLPVFANDYNIVDFQLSLYMGVAILGAFLLQFPVGFLSDKYDRRTVLFALLTLSATSCIAATRFAAEANLAGLFIATALSCGIIACTYPLSLSETFDKLEKNQLVAAMGCMVLAFALGGVIGPYSASLVMEWVGSAGLFYFLTAVQLLLAAFVIYRIQVRQALPAEEQAHFVMQGGVVTGAVVEMAPEESTIKSGS